MTNGSSDAPADRRIEKTRAALAAAMFRLIGRCDWDEIGVTLICAEANVGRSTFYLHFSSPTALLDHLIATVVARIPGRPDGPMPVLEWLVDHVAENRAVFRHTVTTARSSHVLDRFRAGIVAALLADAGLSSGDAAAIRVAMLIGAAFEGLQHWSRRWRPDELPQLKQDLRKLEAALAG